MLFVENNLVVVFKFFYNCTGPDCLPRCFSFIDDVIEFSYLILYWTKLFITGETIILKIDSDGCIFTHFFLFISHRSGPRCQLSDRCTNKRFQKRHYAHVEVFNTEKKGVGLRALQNLEW